MKRGADWSPLSELLNVQKRMNQLFESALARSDFEDHEGIGRWTPVCDAYEAADELVVCVELPGLERSQIDVRLDGDELIVEGSREMDREREGEQFHRVERSYGKFSRRLRLPSTVDRSAVSATLRDGVLRIVLPTRGGEARGPINVAVS
jgi:HSP20 family protein